MENLLRSSSSETRELGCMLAPSGHWLACGHSVFIWRFGCGYCVAKYLCLSSGAHTQVSVALAVVDL